MLIKIVECTQPTESLAQRIPAQSRAFKGPHGKPLYSYQVSEEEYKSLLELLKQQLRRSDNPLHAMHLGACFCLFVSEQYRRNYNSSWSWSGAEAELGFL